ncbi:TonB-dependent hemoglobin/transferrin/lactoferrin family receptor [Roseibium sp. SCP14]|uniref:TonB-dependent hemoglobin/transferrin/lactoferrin family receptor n=1 Tax=Roseibium sp. SCP14 TaxID=3141375 RepID=UPI00333D9D69
MGLNKTNRTRLMGGVALWVLAFNGEAIAQDTTAETPASETPETVVEESSTGEIVTKLQRIVIGSGVDKVAIDTPQAVTVLDQEAIDDEQAMTIGDLFREVPGVTVIGSDRAAGQSFNIRGIGDLGSADESKIIVTVDGANKFYEQYRVGSFFSDPDLYKQVEILRGPASSTLYGSGAIGGVINFTTKDPSDFLQDGETVAVNVKGMYDSNKDGFMTSGTVAGRINERTEVLLNGIYRRSDDYETGDGTTVSGSAFDSFSGLAKIVHHFGENEEQSVRLSYQRWQSTADDTDYSQTGTFDAFGTIDRDITDQTVVFRYDNPASGNPLLDLSVNLSYSDTTINQEDSSNASSSSQLYDDTEYAYRTWQGKIENTFEHSGGSFENFLTIGTQASYQTRVADADSGAIGFHPEGTDMKFGFFAQNEFIWNDRLTIIPGTRVDFINLSPDSSVSGASDQFEVAFSPKLAALYKINDTISVFGSVAHTERAPTLDEMFSTAGTCTPGPRCSYPGGRSASLNLEKEQSNAVEAGFSLSFWDILQEQDGLQFKTTAFYNDLKDLISSNPDTGQSTAVPYYVNIDEAEIWGIEVEAAYNSRYVFSTLAYSLVRGIDKETGDTLNSIPADTLAMTIGGRLPEQDIEFGWRGLFATGIETGSGTGPFPGYGVHDVFANWKPQEGMLAGYELRASVENVFDKDYQNNLAGDPARGRTFKLTMNKQFSW